MKPIALAFASLLSTSSSFAAEGVEQHKNIATEKNLISSAGKKGWTSGSSPSRTNVLQQSTQPGPSISSTPNLSQLAVPKAPAVAPGGADAQEAPPPDPTTGPDSK